jgi:glucose uptake protein GlcU
MSRLDDELKIALRRDEPPEGFAARVLERIQASPVEAALQPVGKSWWPISAFRLNWLPGRWLTAGALACALLLVTVGVYRHRQEEQARQEAERAKAQVVLALQIASAKLNIAQRKVFENNDHFAGDRSNGGLRKENQ